MKSPLKQMALTMLGVVGYTLKAGQLGVGQVR